MYCQVQKYGAGSITLCSSFSRPRRGEPSRLIGVEFSKTDRNIVGFEVETLA